MARKYGYLIVVGMLVGLIASSRYILRAQAPSRRPAPSSKRVEAKRTATEPRLGGDRAAPGEGQPAELMLSTTKGSNATTLQDAMLRRFAFPFSRPTTLEQVCDHLKRALKAPVVLDVAALDRQSVEREDTVQLELDGVRLKTGLKLLLDQIGLTYRVVAEDNLLIITDREGSEDPADRVWAELQALHRDLHDVQDALDELREFLGDDKGAGPRLHKPTIIDEKPENAGEKPAGAAKKPGDTGQKPPGAVPPAAGQSASPRIPLAGPGRRA
jgi:hypothetical protein